MRAPQNDPACVMPPHHSSLCLPPSCNRHATDTRTKANDASMITAETICKNKYRSQDVINSGQRIGQLIRSGQSGPREKLGLSHNSRFSAAGGIDQANQMVTGLDPTRRHFKPCSYKSYHLQQNHHHNLSFCFGGPFFWNQSRSG